MTGAALLGASPRNWDELVAYLAARDHEALQRLPWYAHHAQRIPRDWDLQRLPEFIARFADVAASSGIRLAALQARLIEPGEFNRGVNELGSKGELLSRATLELVRWAVELAGGQPCRVHCDKHGGRSKYAGLLQQYVTDSWVRVLEEGQRESRYGWGDLHEIAFRVGGDSHVPSAWASMVAKYLRELAMGAWNEFWRSHVGDLRPTAGYPVDARRFLDQIEPAMNRLGLDKSLVWRSR